MAKAEGGKQSSNANSNNILRRAVDRVPLRPALNASNPIVQPATMGQTRNFSRFAANHYHPNRIASRWLQSTVTNLSTSVLSPRIVARYALLDGVFPHRYYSVRYRKRPGLLQGQVNGTTLNSNRNQPLARTFAPVNQPVFANQFYNEAVGQDYEQFSDEADGAMPEYEAVPDLFGTASPLLLEDATPQYEQSEYEAPDNRTGNDLGFFTPPVLRNLYEPAPNIPSNAGLRNFYEPAPNIPANAGFSPPFAPVMRQSEHSSILSNDAVPSPLQGEQLIDGWARGDDFSDTPYTVNTNFDFPLVSEQNDYSPSDVNYSMPQNAMARAIARTNDDLRLTIYTSPGGTGDLRLRESSQEAAFRSQNLSMPVFRRESRNTAPNTSTLEETGANLPRFSGGNAGINVQRLSEERSGTNLPVASGEYQNLGLPRSLGQSVETGLPTSGENTSAALPPVLRENANATSLSSFDEIREINPPRSLGENTNVSYQANSFEGQREGQAASISRQVAFEQENLPNSQSYFGNQSSSGQNFGINRHLSFNQSASGQELGNSSQLSANLQPSNLQSTIYNLQSSNVLPQPFTLLSPILYPPSPADWLPTLRKNPGLHRPTSNAPSIIERSLALGIEDGGWGIEDREEIREKREEGREPLRLSFATPKSFENRSLPATNLPTSEVRRQAETGSSRPYAPASEDTFYSPVGNTAPSIDLSRDKAAFYNYELVSETSNQWATAPSVEGSVGKAISYNYQTISENVPPVAGLPFAPPTLIARALGLEDREEGREKSEEGRESLGLSFHDLRLRERRQGSAFQPEASSGQWSVVSGQELGNSSQLSANQLVSQSASQPISQPANQPISGQWVDSNHPAFLANQSFIVASPSLEVNRQLSLLPTPNSQLYPPISIPYPLSSASQSSIVNRQSSMDWLPSLRENPGLHRSFEAIPSFIQRLLEAENAQETNRLTGAWENQTARTYTTPPLIWRKLGEYEPAENSPRSVIGQGSQVDNNFASFGRLPDDTMASAIFQPRAEDGGWRIEDRGRSQEAASQLGSLSASQQLASQPDSGQWSVDSGQELGNSSQLSASQLVSQSASQPKIGQPLSLSPQSSVLSPDLIVNRQSSIVNPATPSSNPTPIPHPPSPIPYPLSPADWLPSLRGNLGLHRVNPGLGSIIERIQAATENFAWQDGFAAQSSNNPSTVYRLPSTRSNPSTVYRLPSTHSNPSTDNPSANFENTGASTTQRLAMPHLQADAQAQISGLSLASTPTSNIQGNFSSMVSPSGEANNQGAFSNNANSFGTANRQVSFSGSSNFGDYLGGFDGQDWLPLEAAVEASPQIARTLFSRLSPDEQLEHAIEAGAGHFSDAIVARLTNSTNLPAQNLTASHPAQAQSGQNLTASHLAQPQAEQPTAEKPVSVTPSGIQVAETILRSSVGQPLDSSVQTRMTNLFGRSFENVRVHTDERAAEHTAQIGAEAFTVGSNIFFAANRYQPETVMGQALIGHELTHIIQQANLPSLGNGLMLEESGSEERAFEQQAQHTERLLLQHLASPAQPVAPTSVNRFQQPASASFSVPSSAPPPVQRSYEPVEPVHLRPESAVQRESDNYISNGSIQRYISGTNSSGSPSSNVVDAQVQRVKEGEGSSPLDVQKLAEQVYKLVKQQLIIDRERHGPRGGGLPY